MIDYVTVLLGRGGSIQEKWFLQALISKTVFIILMLFILSLIHICAEIELLGINDKEYILKTAVDYIRDDYDFIVIDCPPSLNMLTVNAMTTADTVLVPIQCEYYACLLYTSRCV